MRDILSEKSQKVTFISTKNLKKSEGLQGNFSGGSQKNLKKSLFCRKESRQVTFLSKKYPKISKSHFCVKNISKSQGGLQLRYLFAMQEHVRISECCLICVSRKCLCGSLQFVIMLICDKCQVLQMKITKC